MEATSTARITRPTISSIMPMAGSNLPNKRMARGDVNGPMKAPTPKGRNISPVSSELSPIADCR